MPEGCIGHLASSFQGFCAHLIDILGVYRFADRHGAKVERLGLEFKYVKEPRCWSRHGEGEGGSANSEGLDGFGNVGIAVGFEGSNDEALWSAGFDCLDVASDHPLFKRSKGFSFHGGSKRLGVNQYMRKATSSDRA